MDLHRAIARSLRVAFVAVSGAAFVEPSQAATTITFSTVKTGDVVTTQFLAAGVTISAKSALPAGPDAALVFDSEASNTPSSGDLAFPWSGGNLSTNHFGHTLVVSRDLKDPNGDGLVDIPDAQHAGGQLFFKFSSPLDSFGFDAIHVHSGTEPTTSLIEFFRNGGLEATVPYSDFVDPSSIFYDSTVKFGDHFANHFKPITALKLGVQSFDAVTLVLSAGSAVDNITFTPAAVTPEPSAVVLIGAIMPLLGRRRHSR